MVAHVTPPSRDNRILTEPLTLTEVQVMVCVEPLAQLSPPSGEITVIVGGGGPVMVKFALLISKMLELEALTTFILACVVAEPLTVQD